MQNPLLYFHKTYLENIACQNFAEHVSQALSIFITCDVIIHCYSSQNIKVYMFNHLCV